MSTSVWIGKQFLKCTSLNVKKTSCISARPFSIPFVASFNPSANEDWWFGFIFDCHVEQLSSGDQPSLGMKKFSIQYAHIRFSCVSMLRQHLSNIKRNNLWNKHLYTSLAVATKKRAGLMHKILELDTLPSYQITRYRRLVSCVIKWLELN